jgi:hypothetical protein
VAPFVADLNRYQNYLDAQNCISPKKPTFVRLKLQSKERASTMLLRASRNLNGRPLKEMLNRTVDFSEVEELYKTNINKIKLVSSTQQDFFTAKRAPIN